MKKNLMVISFCCISLFFFSCSKSEYNCHCEGGFTGAGATYKIESTSTGKAKNECSSHNNGSGTADGYYNCQLQ